MAEAMGKKKNVKSDSPISGGPAMTTGRDRDGNTPLHIAAKAGNGAVLKVLLELGSGLEARNDLGQTPLYLAVTSGSQEAVECLLEAGADLQTEAHDGSTLWHAAAALPDHCLLQLLARSGSTSPVKQNNDDVTDIITAVVDTFSSTSQEDNDHTSNVELKQTVKNKVDLNHRSVNLSAKTSDLSVKDKQIDHDPQPCKTNSENKLKKWEDIYRKVNEIVLSSDSEDEGRGSMSVSNKNRKPHAPTKQANQLDMILEEQSRRSKMQVINNLSRFCTNHEKDEDGYTLFHLACVFSAEEAVQRLLKLNVNINDKCKDGLSAILLAATGNSVKIIEMLVKAGANYKEIDDFGRTALHLAANKSNVAVVQKFLTLGLDPNKKCNAGNTALHSAVMAGNDPEIITELIKHGAKKSIRNKKGFTPFSLNCNS